MLSKRVEFNLSSLFFRAKITRPIMKGVVKMNLDKAKRLSSYLIRLGFMSYSAIKGAEHISNLAKEAKKFLTREGR